MSLDKSLKGRNTLVRHRNVLTRAERIEKLRELGRWTDDSTAIGLPKVLNRKVSVGKKVKEKKGEQAAEGEGETKTEGDVKA